MVMYGINDNDIMDEVLVSDIINASIDYAGTDSNNWLTCYRYNGYRFSTDTKGLFDEVLYDIIDDYKYSY